ncbi:ferrochelatase [Paenibacillus sp. y28]|uniref:ferrochelatase n=1 Tax=Paenibacillus sp. y28 TaxID=3129110 RepID=UPI0030196979
MEQRKIGVLVMSYGTPESLDQVEAYYTHIRRGHSPEPQQLKELTDRYEAIGGLFPLRDNTNKQVQALEDELNRRYAGQGLQFACYQGLKHASPFIEDGVRQMAEDGLTEAVGIVLAPHYSVMSVGGYIKRAQETAAALPGGLSMHFVHSYHLHPQLIEALTERVNTALQRFDADRNEIRVIFSAHSLPEKIVEMGDPYPKQLHETAQRIAEAAGVSNWQFAWQSAGQTSVPWLGPDISEVLRHIASEEGVRYVISCPIGFVSDHLEVLYDIDIELQGIAAELGVQLERTASLNTDPRYISVLADAVYGELKMKQTV